MICPKDYRPCCDDLCHGAGCLRMDGRPMLDTCAVCKELVDNENPDCSACRCGDDDFYDEDKAA